MGAGCGDQGVQVSGGNLLSGAVILTIVNLLGLGLLITIAIIDLGS